MWLFGCRSGHFAAEEYETPEEYAQRIWEEMQARRHAQRDAELAAFRRRRCGAFAAAGVDNFVLGLNTWKD